MSTQDLIGKLLEAGQERDAIHVAVAPVVAAETLRPGERVGFVGSSMADAVGVRATELIGIVDPFLLKHVTTGQRFFLFLFPNTVTGMRHEWAHPSFTPESKTTSRISESEAWLRAFAVIHSGSFENLISAAQAGAHVGFGSTSGPEACWGEDSDFWYHLENYTGREFSKEHKAETVFSCAC